MKLKTLVMAAALTIFTMSLAIAKSYDVSFGSATKAGTIQLKAGTYQLKVDGTKATFTDTVSFKSVTTDVKVENVDKKFSDTKVNSVTEGGSVVVKNIELGGSKVKVDF